MISKVDVVSKTINFPVINNLTESDTTPAVVALTAQKNFVYEMNCEGVAESIRVAELVGLHLIVDN